MVHLCAPTTYVKQDKQLCEIYDFKHEDYHKVKCISKSSGIEITEARGDDDVLPSSSQGSTSRWRVWVIPSATRGLTLFSCEPRHQRPSSPPLSIPSRRNRSLYIKLGARIHNLIRGLK